MEEDCCGDVAVLFSARFCRTRDRQVGGWVRLLFFLALAEGGALLLKKGRIVWGFVVLWK